MSCIWLVGLRFEVSDRLIADAGTLSGLRPIGLARQAGYWTGCHAARGANSHHSSTADRENSAAKYYSAGVAIAPGPEVELYYRTGWGCLISLKPGTAIFL